MLAQFFGKHLVEVGADRGGVAAVVVSVVFVAVHRAARDDLGLVLIKPLFPAENPPYIVRRKNHP
jgi:hypothetical protein